MCNGNPFTIEKILPRAGIELGTLDQLVGYLGFNGQYFSLLKRGRKKREMIDEGKMSKQPTPASTVSTVHL